MELTSFGWMLSDIPSLTSTKEMAGFPPERGYFHIKRAAIVPPEVLQGKLFTWVDHYSDDCECWERT